MFLQGLLRKRSKEDPHIGLKSIFYVGTNVGRF
jgi:hypothetical protein